MRVKVFGVLFRSFHKCSHLRSETKVVHIKRPYYKSFCVIDIVSTFRTRRVNRPVKRNIHIIRAIFTKCNLISLFAYLFYVYDLYVFIRYDVFEKCCCTGMR